MVRRKKKRSRKRRKRPRQDVFGKEILDLTKFTVKATVTTGVGIALIDTASKLSKK